MLQRVYVDNYRCMVNLEFAPEPVHLIWGLNGSGKSSLFDVLRSLRELVTKGTRVGELFGPESLTRWDTRAEQTFKLELEGNGGAYRYVLVVEQDRVKRVQRIAREELTFDGGRLYLFEQRETQLYRDDHSEGPRFPSDWSRSGIAGIPGRHDNRRLTWFRERMERMFVVRIDPAAMLSRTEAETRYPEGRLSDFASWYRSLALESPSAVGRLRESLREVIGGFGDLILTSAGEHDRILQMDAASTAQPGGQGRALRFAFDELSDGERALAALYALLHGAVGADTTLCIDEPGNFLALPEIQPWLVELREKVEREGGQAIIASHHPEVINYLAAGAATRFEREGMGPVRARDLCLGSRGGLTASDQLARGWDDGEA